MAENVLGLVLLLISRSHNIDISKISPEKRVYRINVTKRYMYNVSLQNNYYMCISHTPARLKAIVAVASVRINHVGECISYCINFCHKKILHRVFVSLTLRKWL